MWPQIFMANKYKNCTENQKRALFEPYKSNEFFQRVAIKLKLVTKNLLTLLYNNLNNLMNAMKVHALKNELNLAY